MINSQFIIDVVKCSTSKLYFSCIVDKETGDELTYGEPMTKKVDALRDAYLLSKKKLIPMKDGLLQEYKKYINKFIEDRVKENSVPVV